MRDTDGVIGEDATEALVDRAADGVADAAKHGVAARVDDVLRPRREQAERLADAAVVAVAAVGGGDVAAAIAAAAVGAAPAPAWSGRRLATKWSGSRTEATIACARRKVSSLTTCACSSPVGEGNSSEWRARPQRIA